jgi:hypothetical protein
MAAIGSGGGRMLTRAVPAGKPGGHRGAERRPRRRSARALNGPLRRIARAPGGPLRRIAPAPHVSPIEATHAVFAG